MSRGGPGTRGTAALLALTPGRMPARIGVRERRPLRDHVKPWLFWIEHARGLAANTVVGYAFDAKMFVAFCDQIGCVYAEDVSYQVIEAFGASLRGGLGQQPQSVSRRYSALKQLFRFLMREGVVTVNPVELAIRMKMPPRKPPEHMSIEDRELIFTTLGTRRDLAGQRHYALSLFLFYSGLRESETVHLKVEDVHLDPPDNAYLRVRDGKGSKDRLVPIVPRLREALRVYLATTRPGLNPPAAKPWLVAVGLFGQRHLYEALADQLRAPGQEVGLLKNHQVVTDRALIPRLAVRHQVENPRHRDNVLVGGVVLAAIANLGLQCLYVRVQSYCQELWIE